MGLGVPTLVRNVKATFDWSPSCLMRATRDQRTVKTASKPGSSSGDAHCCSLTALEPLGQVHQPKSQSSCCMKYFHGSAAGNLCAHSCQTASGRGDGELHSSASLRFGRRAQLLSIYMEAYKTCTWMYSSDTLPSPHGRDVCIRNVFNNSKGLSVARLNSVCRS